MISLMDLCCDCVSEYNLFCELNSSVIYFGCVWNLWRSWCYILFGDEHTKVPENRFLSCNKLWSMIVYMLSKVGWKNDFEITNIQQISVVEFLFSLTLNSCLRKWWNYSDPLNFSAHICVAQLILVCRCLDIAQQGRCVSWDLPRVCEFWF